MKYRFGQPELTCTNIEAKLGLKRGDVREINIFPDGTIEVNVANDLTLAQKSVLWSLFELTEKTV